MDGIRRVSSRLGAERVIFCERGVRGLSGPTRNTLDLATAVHIKTTLGQPVIVDPSHATGRRDLVVPLSKAAIAAGVDGVMVEVHPDAGDALSDGAQALDFEDSQLSSLGLNPAQQSKRPAALS